MAWEENTHIFPVTYKLGVIIWSIGGAIALTRNGMCSWEYFFKSNPGGRGTCWLAVKSFFTMYLIIGVFVWIEMILRILYLPVDAAFAAVVYCSAGEWNFSTLTKWFGLTRFQKEYFDDDTTGWSKLISTIGCFFTGGRWQVRPLMIQAYENSNDEDIVKFNKMLIWIVVYEELFENVGGLFLTIALAQLKNEVSFLMTLSFLTTLVSALVETGKYIVDARRVGTVDPRKKPDEKTPIPPSKAMPNAYNETQPGIESRPYFFNQSLDPPSDFSC